MVIKKEPVKVKTTKKTDKAKSVLEKKAEKKVTKKKEVVVLQTENNVVETELQFEQIPTGEISINTEIKTVDSKWSDLKKVDINKIKQVKFEKTKYFEEESAKTQIVLHHTVSGTGPRGDIETFTNNTSRIATHFIIDRNGDIYQMFSSKYWAHHLGVQGQVFRKYNFTDAITRNALLDKCSISIELDSWGTLYKMADNRYRNDYGRTISINDEDVIYYGNDFKQVNGFNGKKGFERYTIEQLKSLGELLLLFNNKYNIPLDYKGDEMFNVDIRALSGESGIWTHVSYRSDKTDCHPDPNLISLLKSLNSLK